MEPLEEHDEPISPAERVYSAWQVARDRGDPANLDGLCARHPELAAEIREIAEFERRRESLYREALRDVSGIGSAGHADLSIDAIITQLRELGAVQAKYRIGRELGRGGMGAVFEAEDRLLGRKVAYKFTPDPKRARARLPIFRREMELAASLNHPGIAGVHDAGVDESGRAYFTMPLVRGRNLSEVLACARAGHDGWNTIRVVGVLAQIAETMAYVHTQGVIHRDLKPSNIRVGEFGEVFVMDWGLAKRLNGAADQAPVDLDHPSPQQSDILHCGTLPYSSPEQWGSGALVGSATDVYSIGVMLYELLTGRLPFHREGEQSVDSIELLRRLREEVLQPVHTVAREAPAELASICARAMEADPARRYSDCSALARDLRAFLEQRVVSAHESGTWAETRKWIQRNRSLASVLALVVAVSMAGALAFRWKANEATRVTEDLLSLSLLRDLRELESSADTLWPIRTAMVSRYQDWIERANRLLDGWSSDGRLGPSQEAHAERLRVLQGGARAAGLDGNEPSEWESMLADVDVKRLWYRRMLGDEPWPEAATISLETPSSVDDVQAIRTEVLDRVKPLVIPIPEQRVAGREVEARLLLESTRTRLSVPDREIEDLLGWANLLSGRFAEVELVLAGRNWGEGDPVRMRNKAALAREFAKWRGEDAVAERRRELKALDRKHTVLATLVEQSRPGRSVDISTVWWISQLSPIVTGATILCSDELGGLLSRGTSPEHGWGVLRRLEEARTLRARSMGSPEAVRRWAEAIRAIAASPLYREARWPGGQFTPQEGLLPIGADPRSGLWEFLVVLSGTEPPRNHAGVLVPGEESGVVLVLIPGGSFLMGSQSTEPSKPNYDPDASLDEGPVREVSLGPYFIGKHEMTQGQWRRFTGSNPSNLRPISANVTSLAHPVEQVSWADCNTTMLRMGLALPTEAQWEFACKGGTGARWWTGFDRELLRGKANLADQAARRGGSAFTSINSWPDLDDGWARHAIAGSLEANPFGLHEVHGNVIEWCADAYGSWSAESATDPVAVGDSNSDRVARGGSYANRAEDCRSTMRSHDISSMRHWAFGLRPARAVEAAQVR